MKILYFTSTGNSLYIAKQFDAELLSIPQMIKKGQYNFEDDIIGIVYPVYDWGLPKLIRKFFKKITLSASYIFVIATYGDNAGTSLHEADKALKKQGISADYFESILMADNYLPLFESGKQVAMLPQKKIKENLTRITDEISAKQSKTPNKSIVWNGVANCMRVVQPLISNHIPRWTFRVNNACIGCGICEKVCPVHNVAEKNGDKPIFGNQCESCFACVHHCPKNAIHLKIEKSHVRFRHEYITLKEIIESNNQL